MLQDSNTTCKMLQNSNTTRKNMLEDSNTTRKNMLEDNNTTHIMLHNSSKCNLIKSVMSVVVHKINCMSCSASYIGETTRRVSVRMAEHKLAIGTGPQ